MFLISLQIPRYEPRCRQAPRDEKRPFTTVQLALTIIVHIEVISTKRRSQSTNRPSTAITWCIWVTG